LLATGLVGGGGLISNVSGSPDFGVELPSALLAVDEDCLVDTASNG